MLCFATPAGPCATYRSGLGLNLVIVVFVALITVISVILVERSIGGIIGVIVGPVLSFKEQALDSVSDIDAPVTVAHKIVNTVDDVLWDGEGSEDLAIKSYAGCEDHEEVCPLGIAGGT